MAPSVTQTVHQHEPQTERTLSQEVSISLSGPKLPCTLPALLETGDAEADALLGSGPCLRHGGLQQHAVLFAHGLRKAGVARGQCVSIADTNTVAFVIAFLGTTYARAVAAPLNTTYKLAEFKFFLEDAASKLLILPEGGNVAAEAAAADLGMPVATMALHASAPGGLALTLRSKVERFNFSTAPPTTSPTPRQHRNPALEAAMAPLPASRQLLDMACGGTKSFPASQQLNEEPCGNIGSSPASRRLPDPPHGDDVALFLHTSGTTSQPKGVPLTHANLAASLQNIIATYELCAADRSLLVMPLFHVHGLMAGLLAPLAAGAAVIMPAEGRFAASSFWRDAVEHCATFFSAVPTMHQILLARAATDYPADSPPPLRFIRSCSAPLAPATLHKLEAAFGVPVLEAYAMTEAAHQMTSNPLPQRGRSKPGTVGRPQGSIKVAILDEQHRILPAGCIGEVCIRGPSVTSGYHNRPEANVEAYAGGWFHTGDQGSLDEEGYLTLTGRLKELINRGGEKISPVEVDGALLSHPAVAEAVAFAAPDELYGEVVAAAVVLNSAAETDLAETSQHDLVEGIRRHIATKLADFKVPDRIYVTSSLPKGPTGKVLRRLMAAHFNL